MSFKWSNSLLLIALVLVFIELKGSFIPHFCLFEEFLNVHCPFCGLTKSFEEILNQKFSSALKIHFMLFRLEMFFMLKSILTF